MPYDRKLIDMAGPEANRFFQKNDRSYFRSREFWMAFDEQFDVRATRATLSMGGEDHFRMRRGKRPGYPPTTRSTLPFVRGKLGGQASGIL